MKHRGLLGVIALFCLTGCCSIVKQETSPLFWRVTNEGSTVYLLGSIHVATPNIYPLDDVIMEAFQQSDFLMEEMDYSAIATEPVIDAAKDISQDAEIDAALLAEAITTATQYNLNPEALEDANAITLSRLLMHAAYEKAGLSPESGLDLCFFDLAKQAKKQVLGVETPAQWLEDMKKFPTEYQNWMLAESLDVEKATADTKALYGFWCNGDAAALETSQLVPLRQMAQESEIGKFAYTYSVLERNERMVQAAKQCLDSGQNTFFVAGVAHMLGDEGIPAQLEALGYAVEQIATD